MPLHAMHLLVLALALVALLGCPTASAAAAKCTITADYGCVVDTQYPHPLQQLVQGAAARQEMI